MATKKTAEVTKKKVKRERSDEGPRGWLFPMLESAYTKLIPPGEGGGGGASSTGAGPDVVRRRP